MSEVVVVTGIGGMGMACARRLGAGRHLLVADANEGKLIAEAEQLEVDGFAVTARTRSMCRTGRQFASLATRPHRSAGSGRWYTPPDSLRRRQARANPRG